jgi:hypothetical protein
MKPQTLGFEDDELELLIQEAQDRDLSLNKYLQTFIWEGRDKNILKMKLTDDEIEKIEAIEDSYHEHNLTQIIRNILDQKTIITNFSEEELSTIDANRNDKSRDDYLRDLVHRDEIENAKTGEGDDEKRINFRSILGEEAFTKISGKVGENFEEYLKTILLQQANDSILVIDCSEEEPTKIDSERGEKSRAEYLREMIKKDQKVMPPPTIMEIEKTIKADNLETRNDVKTQIEEHQKETEPLLRLLLDVLKSRLPYPESWRYEGTLIERLVMKKAIIIFIGLGFISGLVAIVLVSPVLGDTFKLFKRCFEAKQIWPALEWSWFLLWRVTLPCLLGQLSWLLFPKILRSETFHKILGGR